MVCKVRAVLLAGFVLGGVGLADGARADQSPAGDEPVGTGYHVQTYENALRSDPYRLYLLLRVMEVEGKIKVCGAYIADMSDRRYSTVVALLGDMNSSLRLGAPDKRRHRLRPSFLAGKRAIVLEGLEGTPRLPVQDLRANCVLTDGAWEDRFATEPFTLDLRETRLRGMFSPYR
jgi:hypothetical protein